MSVPERVRGVIEPVVAAEDLELFDLEQAGPVLRVTVERAGGLDMGVIASVTRAISRALDEHDPIAGRYTLEVSSPGLERPLRTPAPLRLGHRPPRVDQDRPAPPCRSPAWPAPSPPPPKPT